jgi:diketogulonate reductase-like aldo/keto reductase
MVNDLVVSVGGVAIPALGCGTWQLRGNECTAIVAEALRVGFRHIDTAQGYANEAEVGAGIRESGVPRSEIFLTTKVRPDFASRTKLLRSVEDSLGRLGLDVIDLLLIHWPNPDAPVAEMMEALSLARRAGLARHIGVSNFTIAMLDEAVRLSPEPIVTDQIEYHPYVDQGRLLHAIRRHGLAITAYCPLALGRVADDPTLRSIGERYGKTPAQVALRWLIQQGDVIAIPKTASAARLRENFGVFDFSLSPDDMAAVDAIPRNKQHLVNELQWVPAWD